MVYSSSLARSGFFDSGGPARGQGGAAVLTIGHATHSVEQFIGILKAHQASGVIDIRTVPLSRVNPQFNAGMLPRALRRAGIAYQPMPGLGGLRRSRPGSSNAGWRNASFRGFADYMLSSEFEAALGKAVELILGGRFALMCAEALPWRCHRSLIADALLARGVRVTHILSNRCAQEHRLRHLPG